MNITRRELIKASSLSFLTPSTRLFSSKEGFSATSRKLSKGVNLAGAEFFNKAGGKPGFQYFYPDARDVDFFLERGFTTFRIPFKWERIQRSLESPLGTGAELNDFRLLAASIKMILAKRGKCILDMHNYGRRVGLDGKTDFVGSSSVPTSTFIDCWTRLARSFDNDTDVWLGLMNEPHGISASAWSKVCQETVLALRKNGIRNRILVPGTAWSGAHSWLKSGNAAAFENFLDPDNNFDFEVHQYLDKDSSGTSARCSFGAGKRRLVDFQQWCKRKPGRTGFLGEFGSGDPRKSGQEACSAELYDLLATIEANSDIWTGWTAWGGGRWWGKDYPLRLQPINPSLPDNGYLQILRQFAA